MERNWSLRLLPLLLISLLATLTLVGCGGGSSSTGGASISSIIATDDLNTGYDHVWVSIKSVNLVTSAGTVNAFTNTSGLAVDLTTLRDSNGNRFLFLNNISIPAGTYTGVQVTVDNNVSIFPTGATTATAATFQTTGDFTMSLTFATPKTTNVAKNDIVIDFNLANWVLTGTTVTATGNAFLSEGPTHNLGDTTRWETHDYHGSVNGLAGTAGSQTFMLDSSSSSPTVTTTSTTALFNSDGSASPTLTDGENVIVTGTFNPSTNTITAAGIEILITPTNVPATATGAVSNISTSAFTFTLTPRGCDGFMPHQTTLSVTTTSSTLFYGLTGTTYDQADFFAALAAGDSVTVQGTVTSGVLTATSVQITSVPSTGGSNSGGHHPNLVRIEGPTSALDTTTSTFMISKTFWEGFFGQTVRTATILYSSSTVWIQQGQTITQSAALTLIGNGATSNVRGTLDATVTDQIDATQVEFGH